MKKLVLTLYLLISTLLFLTAQKSYLPELTGPYLGQKPPGLIPEIFAPGIVSTEKAWEAAISFSPDGKEVFFTRREDIQRTENRIMYSEFSDGKWTKPSLAPFARDITDYEAFI
jgi:hypothetical protein